LTWFRVHNPTGETVWVTPRGEAFTPNAEFGGPKWELTQYLFPFIAVTAWRTRDIPIAAGKYVRIVYEWRNMIFTELLVRDRNGQCRALQVYTGERMPSSRHRHWEDVWIPSDFTSLP